MRQLAIFAFTIGALVSPWSQAQDEALPYPAGRSEHVIEGYPTTLHVPDKISREKPASLVILLHGYGGSGRNLSTLLGAWPSNGYLVCAPEAPAKSWNQSKVRVVIKIAKKLLATMPLDPDRIHVMGFSNGGYNLGHLTFDEDLKPRSAIYVGSGHVGRGAPKWAKKRTGILAAAGADDPAARQTLATVNLMRGKVRTVEARFQDNLGHKWPREHTAYMLWWNGVQEGRCAAGYDLNFDWGQDFKVALESQHGKKKGGVLVYVYDSSEEDDPQTKKLQNETFFDPKIRFYGRQLACCKIDRANATLPEGIMIKTTPALLIYDSKGKLKKTLEGKIKAKTLAAALKSIVPIKKTPRQR